MRKILLFTLIVFTSLVAWAEDACLDNDSAPIVLSYDPPNDRFFQDPPFTIFPNPAIDHFSINDQNKAVKQVVIYNLVGRKIKSFDAQSSNKYFISELQKGLYLVQLLGEQNEILTTKRINKR